MEQKCTGIIDEKLLLTDLHFKNKKQQAHLLPSVHMYDSPVGGPVDKIVDQPYWYIDIYHINKSGYL